MPMNTPINPIIALSIIYRFRHEKYVLEESITELREVLQRCTVREARYQITKKLREWASELEYINNTIEQRTLEFQCAFTAYAFFQHDEIRAKNEINDQNRVIDTYRRRKTQTMQRLKNIALTD